MSTQSEINRIKQAKTDIANAIASKGVAVPNGTKLNGMATLIAAIPSKEEIVLSFFPIGSIVMNITGQNPSEYIGGTWVSWCKGRTPVGLGNVEANTITTFGNVAAGEKDWITVEAKGGEYNHTLTKNELPTVEGNINFHYGDASTNVSSVDGVFSATKTGSKYRNGGTEGGGATSVGSIKLDFGNDAPHNNIMPYQTCYFWKRTA